MTPVLPPEVATAIVTPKAYGEWTGLNDHFTWARANMPLGVAEAESYDPFWAVTFGRADNIPCGTRIGNDFGLRGETIGCR